MSDAPDPSGAPAAPFLRIVSGDPTPEELAAIVAVVAGRAGSSDAADNPEPSAWADRARGLRTPLPHGPGAWRASAFPR